MMCVCSQFSLEIQAYYTNIEANSGPLKTGSDSPVPYLIIWRKELTHGMLQNHEILEIVWNVFIPAILQSLAY